MCIAHYIRGSRYSTIATITTITPISIAHYIRGSRYSTRGSHVLRTVRPSQMDTRPPSKVLAFPLFCCFLPSPPFSLPAPSC
jgi:hypothetical protein